VRRVASAGGFLGRAAAGWRRLVRDSGGVLHRLARREIATELVVAAPPAVVWEVLTEFASYPSWNPFLPWISGEASPGSRVRAVALPLRGPGMHVRARVTAVAPAAELRWTGVLFFAWLFRGRHYFVLEELPGRDNRPAATLLRHGEVLGGILTPFLGAAMAYWMRPGFERMNQALRVRAEEAAGATG
jgi:hypothetical protein